MLPPQAPPAEAPLAPAFAHVEGTNVGMNAGLDTVLEPDSAHADPCGNEGPEGDSHAQQVLRED